MSSYYAFEEIDCERQKIIKQDLYELSKHPEWFRSMPNTYPTQNNEAVSNYILKQIESIDYGNHDAALGKVIGILLETWLVQSTIDAVKALDMKNGVIKNEKNI